MVIKVSLKTQIDNSFPRSINRKIHVRYIGVHVLGSLLPSQNSFLSIWLRYATVSLDILFFTRQLITSFINSNSSNLLTEFEKFYCKVR